jgi:hypothetical protein
VTLECRNILNYFSYFQIAFWLTTLVTTLVRPYAIAGSDRCVVMASLGIGLTGGTLAPRLGLTKQHIAERLGSSAIYAR